MSNSEDNSTKELIYEVTNELCKGCSSKDLTYINSTKTLPDLPGMISSLPDMKEHVSSNREDNQFIQLENPSDVNLHKLSINLKKNCSIRVKLPHNIKETDLQSVRDLSPEHQIKILEDNLKILQSNKVKCVDDQSKNDKFSKSLAISRPPSENNNTFSSFIKIKGDQQPHEEPNNIGNIADCSKVSTCFTNPISLTVLNPKICSKEDTFNRNSFKSYSLLKNKNTKLIADENAPPILQTRPVFGPCSQTMPWPGILAEKSANKSDVDNQFEYTLEQENIVSFVCSPRPTQNEKFDKTIKKLEPAHLDTDVDTDKQSDSSSFKEDSLSDYLSKSTLQSNLKINSNVDKEHNTKSNNPIIDYKKLLWHPSLPQNVPKFHLMTKTFPAYNLHTLNDCSIIYSKPERISSDLKLEYSVQQQAILFRETALRGCYSIDTIIKHAKLSSNLGLDVKSVRDAILSKIRFEPKQENFIPESLDSVLDIFRAWIKLNSHFESKGFTEALLQYGIEHSIISEFLKWQSFSRIFVDKIINAFQKITSEENVINGANDSESGKLNEAQSSKTLKVPNNSDLPYLNESLCKLTESHSKLNLLNSDHNQNKNWKHRRFIPGQPKGCSHKHKFDAISVTNSRQVQRTNVGSNLRPSAMHNQLHANNCRMPVSNTLDAASNNDIFPENTGRRYRAVTVDNLSTVKSTNVKPPTVNSSALELTGFIKEMPFATVYSAKSACMNHNYQMSSSVSNKQLNDELIIANHRPADSPFSRQPHCMATGDKEIGCRTDYLKTGLHTPVQKFIDLKRFENPEKRIEGTTSVTGIASIFWKHLQNPTHRSKGKSKSKLVDKLENNYSFEGKYNDTCKTAVKLAENLRDNLTNKISENGPDLKFSETISLKTHFLLSDNASQDGSSSDSKLDIEVNDVEAVAADTTAKTSAPTRSTMPQDISLGVNKWLTESLNDKIKSKQSLSEGQPQQYENMYSRSNYHHNENTDSALKASDSCEKGSYQLLKHVSVDPKQLTHTGNTLSLPKNQAYSGFNGYIASLKKIKKYKKIREEFPIDFYDHKVMFKKPKSVFKRSITKQVNSKLETILDCVWNAGVSSLIEENFKTDQDAMRIELKIRGPLYLQAMRCKLSNHSYDTLEQALSDFHQYFNELKNKNKGDEQCEEVVGVLEQMFFDLVERSFGSTRHPQPQYLNFGMNTLLKPRRKRALKKC